ncbi:MAG: CoA transferase [Pseudomonadales bacterium]|nr:CoA transferase [Pseudomonadales bacterium]
MNQDFPLADLRVLDLSRVLAGPFAGRMLSDLGAEVVKVEPPNFDVTRNWGAKTGSISGYYHQQNAGKKNISINLKNDAGVELLKSLLKKTDILIENFRPDVMSRLGLGWDSLHELNPRLIMLSISGFGHNGPESKRAAYAPIIHAETGSIQRQAEKSEGKQVEMCMSFADTNAGLHGLVGLLAAVHQRHRSGQGQHIDIAMVDAMLATDDQTHYYLDDVDVNTAASEVWDATGGAIILAGDFRYIWQQAVTSMGVKDPTPMGASLPVKIKCRRDAFSDYLNSHDDRDTLVAQLDKANLAWGNVFESITYLQDSPTLKHRNSIVAVDDRHGGTRPTFQSPYRFSDAPSGVRAGAPFQGEHNNSILTEWLNMSPKEIETLTENKVLVSEQ